jgi:hypothetical protein
MGGIPILNDTKRGKDAASNNQGGLKNANRSK